MFQIWPSDEVADRRLRYTEAVTQSLRISNAGWQQKCGKKKAMRKGGSEPARQLDSHAVRQSIGVAGHFH